MSALNTAATGRSVFGKVNVLQPQASRQFLYCLAPQPSLTGDVRLLSGATNIGKLDMVWRSNLGERGRLQTSQLQRMVGSWFSCPNIFYATLVETVNLIVFFVFIRHPITVTFDFQFKKFQIL